MTLYINDCTHIWNGMHDIVFIKMDNVACSTTQRNVDQTQIKMGLPDYDRDDETEDHILISHPKCARFSPEVNTLFHAQLMDS